MTQCANQGDSQKCNQLALRGHIYCPQCRLANGGYDRYNPPREIAIQTANSRSLYGTRQQ